MDLKKIIFGLGGLYTVISPFITFAVLMQTSTTDTILINLISGVIYLIGCCSSIFFIFIVMQTLHLSNINKKSNIKSKSKSNNDNDNYVNFEDLEK